MRGTISQLISRRAIEEEMMKSIGVRGILKSAGKLNQLNGDI